MSETKQKSLRFSCLGKLVFLLWLVVIGAVGGVWLGINLERMYPGMSVPVVGKIIEQVPLVTHETRTPNGLIMSIIESTRTGKNLEIRFNVTNDGDKPVELNDYEFHLVDKQNKQYDKTSISENIEDVQYMLSFLDPLNPGISEEYHLVFAVPANVKSFDLYYQATKIGRVQ